jgi:hypothetical protein
MSPTALYTAKEEGYPQNTPDTAPTTRPSSQPIMGKIATRRPLPFLPHIHGKGLT